MQSVAKYSVGGFALRQLRLGVKSSQVVMLQSESTCPFLSALSVSTCYKAARPGGSILLTRRFCGLQGERQLSRPAAVGRAVVRNVASKRKDVVPGAQQDSAVTTGEKVRQAGKDAGYTGVFIVGIGVTGVMTYAIARELFSGNSPNGVYSRAFKMCKKSDELENVLGQPLKGYGEMTRRGRRRHTNHSEYEVDGVKVMRMKFYVEGPFGKGTAQLEVRQNNGRKYEFRYLFVTLDQYPHSTIVIEDNR